MAAAQNARGHSAPPRLGPGRRRCPGADDSHVYHELRRIAHRYMAGERRPHLADDGPGERGLCEAGRFAKGQLAESGALLCALRAVDAADSGGFRPVARLPEAGRRGAKDHASIEDLLVRQERGRDLVALDDALKALADLDPRKSQVVELRFFGGLSVEETAEVLKVCPDTVMRDWRMAKVWLGRELGAEKDHAS